MNKIIIFFLSAFILWDCSKKAVEENLAEAQLSDEIRLVDIEHATREEVASALNLLSSCNPKIIAINVIFEGNRHLKADSDLYHSIKNAGNIILVSNLDGNDAIVNSDSMFVKASMAQGLLVYGLEGEYVRQIQETLTRQDRVLHGFPIIIGSYSDVDKAEKLLNPPALNRFNDIKIVNDHPAFKSISQLSSNDCQDFKDKIIMLGYLGSDEEDKYLISEKTNIPGTVILANVVSDLLKD